MRNEINWKEFPRSASEKCWCQLSFASDVICLSMICETFNFSMPRRNFGFWRRVNARQRRIPLEKNTWANNRCRKFRGRMVKNVVEGTKSITENTSVGKVHVFFFRGRKKKRNLFMTLQFNRRYLLILSSPSAGRKRQSKSTFPFFKFVRRILLP